ncbi:MAG: hypothetical protein HRU75_10250 [Planctomycetia bacterium]|nr:MAG: hypothetical protein HRU75_10250 [Planctomycetia bacterium]
MSANRLRAIRATAMGYVAAVLALSAASGCSSSSTRDRAWGIPLGEWEGSGTFVYECRSRHGPDGRDECEGQERIVRDYPTTLRIERAVLDGHDVVVLKILSSRGDIPHLDNRTDLRVALVESQQVHPRVRMFRMVAAQFNPSEGERMSYEPPHDGAYHGVLLQTGDQTVLQLHYQSDFVDTLRFSGSGVDKAGLVQSDEVGLVHWSERLRRRD